MKVMLVTSWNERCGIAEYAANLKRNVKNADIHIADRLNFDRGIGWDAAQYYDIIHINYEPGLFQNTCSYFRSLRTYGAKRMLLTLHTTHEGDNSSFVARQFDRVVVHEKTTEGFTYVPMGILKHEKARDYALLRAKTLNSSDCSLKIGTAGFPFPWKGMHQVAQAAELLLGAAVIIAPESRHVDTMEMKKVCLNANPKCFYSTEWISEQEVIDSLAMCNVTVFPYQGGNAGISGAVRLGLASGRPIVLTRCRQFRDLFDYEDEIEFINEPTPEAIAKGICDVIGTDITLGKRPKRVLEDMSWEKVGMMYSSIYEEMMK